MAEGNGLLNRHTGNGIVGSNPTVTATHSADLALVGAGKLTRPDRERPLSSPLNHAAAVASAQAG